MGRRERKASLSYLFKNIDILEISRCLLLNTLCGQNQAAQGGQETLLLFLDVVHQNKSQGSLSSEGRGVDADAAWPLP